MRQRLIEKGFWSSQEVQKLQSLQEYLKSPTCSRRLKEAVSQYDELNKMGVNVYRVPISAFDVVNLNGRFYPKSLWERVIRDQRHIWEGAVGLADHPEEGKDGSFKDISCVWLNLALDEGTKKVWGDVVFVGPNGRLAEEVMRVGGRVGFSSSGFGEIQEQEIDGVKVNVVVPETYEIERPADLVTNPSQNVCGTMAMKLEPQPTNTGPIGAPVDVMNTPELQKESRQQNSNDNQKKEKTMTKVPLYEDKVFRKTIKDFLAEVQQKDNPHDRLKEYEEILAMFQEGYAPDLRVEVESLIQEEKKEIDRLLQAGLLLKENLGSVAVENTEQALKAIDESIKEDIKSIERKYQDKIHWYQERISNLRKKLLSSPSPRELLELEEQISDYEKELRQTRLIVRRLKSDYTTQTLKLKEKLESFSRKIQELTQENVKLANEKKVLETKNGRLQKEIDEDRKKIVELTKKLQEANKIVKKYHELRESAFVPTVSQSWVREQDPLKGVINLNQPEVVSFYQDLVARHGDKIVPYREKFLNCKTLTEASSLYNRIWDKLDTDANKEPPNYTILNDSIDGKTFLEKKLPKGWV